MLPALIALAGCGGALVNGSSSGSLSISPGTATIDANCTGCNTTTASGGLVEQFSATLSGGTAKVNWTVSGGDAKSGPGTINSSGQYAPPTYLTANSVQVTVTAELASNPSTTASATLTVTPGFLQPLTPQNVALGANGTVTITGYIAEAGGTTGINYAVASSSTGSSGGQGSLGSSICARSSNAFTYCTVTYTAPASITAAASTYVVATIGTSTSKEATKILLNTEGISSNPAGHQKELTTPILLGSSGGNNNDYDTKGNQIVDCCGGTLGSLIQNSGGTQYLLSCNHVLARSDQASVGEMIVQPGLIDNNCTPYGDGSGTTPVGVLTAWLPLSSNATNVDAAIAQVDSGAVKTSGDILELGTLQGNGTLAAAPPGISSTGGKGEPGSLNLVVAKSGRTTGLTCASISALNLNVKVDYYKNCDETTPYLTKTYTNQIAIEGSEFSDAGDSGSLVVDASNAEPVGLFFAGSVTNTGVSEGVANPAPTVLAELGSQQGTTYTFVGTADHPVSCLNYGAATGTAAQSTTLSGPQLELAQQAVGQARMLINPTMGILGVAAGKSSDRAGEAAVILYVDQSMKVSVPQTVSGVRTQVIPTTSRAVSAGAAPQSAVRSSATAPLTSAVFNQAVTAKEQVAQSLMQQNPAYFGVGVGQSLDNPDEASLVIYVDRRQVPATLPPIVNGLRARYVIMDRLHVTRSYLQGPVRSTGHCMAHPVTHQANGLGVPLLRRQLGLQP
ncbi:MAG: hypothetical protein P4K93_09045 [Terracidiphilus sp.]|nr:hypothetical protein [Terracidiphilus sp.]MDR3798286.1 hypothetical protein [Terracidiphilus sp.]